MEEVYWLNKGRERSLTALESVPTGVWLTIFGFKRGIHMGTVMC